MKPQIHTSRAFAGTDLRNGGMAAVGSRKKIGPDRNGTNLSPEPKRSGDSMPQGSPEGVSGAKQRASSNSPGQASAPPWVLEEEEPCPEWAASQNVLSIAPFGPDSAGPASNLARAFSLLELLVVVAILGMLMALTLPSMRSVLSANVITQGGQLVADQLVFARQEAIARNGDVAVRLCKFDDPNDARPGDVVGGLQSFRVKADGTREPLGRLVRMPTGATISTNTALSGILLQTAFQTAGAQDPNLPGVGKNYSWLDVLFHADGATSLPQDSSRTNNFLTVVNSRDSEADPANYYSIMIESRNGRIKTFRP